MARTMTAATTTDTPPRRPKHKQQCSRPDLGRRIVDGLRRLECPECGRYITLQRGERSPFWEDLRPTYAATAPPPPPAPRPVLGYACRDHGHPVTWRGNGCPRCDRERREAQRARAEKRRARMDALHRAARRSDTPTE